MKGEANHDASQRRNAYTTRKEHIYARSGSTGKGSFRGGEVIGAAPAQPGDIPAGEDDGESLLRHADRDGVPEPGRGRCAGQAAARRLRVVGGMDEREQGRHMVSAPNGFNQGAEVRSEEHTSELQSRLHLV